MHQRRNKPRLNLILAASCCTEPFRERCCSSATTARADRVRPGAAHSARICTAGLNASHPLHGKHVRMRRCRDESRAAAPGLRAPAPPRGIGTAARSPGCPQLQGMAKWARAVRGGGLAAPRRLLPRGHSTASVCCRRKGRSSMTPRRGEEVIFIQQQIACQPRRCCAVLMGDLSCGGDAGSALTASRSLGRFGGEPGEEGVGDGRGHVAERDVEQLGIPAGCIAAARVASGQCVLHAVRHQREVGVAFLLHLPHGCQDWGQREGTGADLVPKGPRGPGGSRRCSALRCRVGFGDALTVLQVFVPITRFGFFGQPLPGAD